jgi:predicted ATPase
MGYRKLTFYSLLLAKPRGGRQMITPSSIPVISQRYRLLSRLGEGGMGEVFRAYDRLDQQEVALKRVLPQDSAFSMLITRTDNSQGLRLALAQEFQVLASLRHPNIISVLDYGFDFQNQPYYTMNLLSGGQDLLSYAQHLPLAEKYELIGQFFRALIYLSRRGIVHRDLKPSNVLVANSTLHILDFGLSVMEELANKHSQASSVSGTLLYMAPEGFSGAAATAATDQYALGIIIYQLLVGRHPFDDSFVSAFIDQTLSQSPQLNLPELNAPMQALLARLLAKDPAGRFDQLEPAIALLSEAAGHPIANETVAIRESFLQAARFVGRQSEMATLESLLNQSLNGEGAAALVGGESGSGKSRISQELRTQALVRGVTVLRGQAIREAGAPYHIWRDPLRWLVLSNLSNEEASILKPLVTDIATLLEQPVADAPELASAAANERLITTILAIFGRQKQPLLLVLDDLQWADSASLELAARLLPNLAKLPLLMVGIYRNDEAPNLPNTLPGAVSLALPRLPLDEIATLGQAMLGESKLSADILALLAKETAGNAFFVVETIRALAEQSGGLGQVTSQSLPASVITSGMQNVLSRRLGFVNNADKQLLVQAAIAGRALDLAVLRALDLSDNLDSWLTRCAAAAIIERQDKTWRFVHDKLREQLLAQTSAEEIARGHRYLALATENTYPNDTTYANNLARHWQGAGNAEKAVVYYVQAGDVATKVYAYVEARAAYENALQIFATLPAEASLASLHNKCLIAWAKISVASSDAATLFARMDKAEALLPQLSQAEQTRSSLDIAYVRGRVFSYSNKQLAAIGQFQIVLAGAQDLNDPEMLAFASMTMGSALCFQGRYTAATPLLLRATQIFESRQMYGQWAYAISFYACAQASQGQLTAALELAPKALARAEESKDLTLLGSIYGLFCWVYYQLGDAELMLQKSYESAQAAKKSANRVFEYMALTFTAVAHSWRKQHEQMRDCLAQREAIKAALGGVPIIMDDVFGSMVADMLLGTGDVEGSRNLALKMIEVGKAVNSEAAQAYAARAYAYAMQQMPEVNWASIDEQLGIAIPLFSKHGFHLEVARTRLRWGKFYQTRGLLEEARACWGQAADQFRQSGLLGQLAEAEGLLAQKSQTQ